MPHGAISLILTAMIIIAVGIEPVAGATDHKEGLKSLAKTAKDKLGIPAGLICLAILFGSLLDGLREGDHEKQQTADFEHCILLCAIIGLLVLLMAYLIALIVR